MAEKTIEKFLARAVRLYEQERGEPFGSPPLLGPYAGRWERWQEEPLLRRPQQTNKYDGYLSGRDAYNHCVTGGLIVASAAAGAKILASG